MKLRCQRMSGCLLLAATVLVSGCADKDKLVYENYTHIRAHSSTLDEVELVLGEPTNKLDDRWIYERPNKHLIVIVEFDKTHRVTRTQWIDALGESWHDTKDEK